MKKFGLTKEEAAISLREHGNNALSQPPRATFIDKLLDNFRDPIIRILILALLVNVFFVYMGHGDWIETAGIFVAILLATFVSTWSEYSNENAFQKLQEEAHIGVAAEGGDLLHPLLRQAAARRLLLHQPEEGVVRQGEHILLHPVP